MFRKGASGETKKGGLCEWVRRHEECLKCKQPCVELKRVDLDAKDKKQDAKGKLPWEGSRKRGGDTDLLICRFLLARAISGGRRHRKRGDAEGRGVGTPEDPEEKGRRVGGEARGI